MNASPAHDHALAHPFTPHADPAELVGRWARVRGDHADEIGVLLHATRTVGTGIQGWEWSLRTPTGVVTGIGELRAAPLDRHERGGVRATRRGLRAVRAELAELAPADDPALTEATEDLDLMELQLAAQP